MWNPYDHVKEAGRMKKYEIIPFAPTFWVAVGFFFFWILAKIIDGEGSRLESLVISIFLLVASVILGEIREIEEKNDK